MSPYLSVNRGRLLRSHSQHTHWESSGREPHLAAFKASFTKHPRRRKCILSSLFLTLCGCWLLLLKGLKLCVLPPHGLNIFQNNSFNLDRIPENLICPGIFPRTTAPLRRSIQTNTSCKCQCFWQQNLSQLEILWLSRGDLLEVPGTFSYLHSTLQYYRL